MIETLVFYLAATLAIGGALAVILARTPLTGALSLIVTLVAVAMLYLLLDATFVAAMQVLVYAGAIMVLFVFVIMLLNLGPESGARPSYGSLSKLLGGAAIGYFVVRLIGAVATGAAGRPVDGSIKSVGQLLLSDYLFAFESISVLLLVAVVGAVVLGLRRLT